MLPWVECPKIEIDLDRPITERFREVPATVIEHARMLLDTLLAPIPSWVRLVADVVRLRTQGRFHQEALCLARMVGQSWRSVMLGSVLYDLVLSALRCTTVALATPAGPVLARNMDWPPEDVLARTSYLIRASRGGRLTYAHAGWPGAIGVVTGLSARGFAVALNAVRCPQGTSKLGYPVMLHLRRVLEDAEDFAGAVRMLSNQYLVAPCLLTVVGTRNDERVVIERTPRRYGHRWGREGEPLIATNHYRLLFAPRGREAPEVDETSCGRYEAAARLFAAPAAGLPADDDALLHALSNPEVIQDITAQHVIARPRTREMRHFVPRRLVADSNL